MALVVLAGAFAPLYAQGTEAAGAVGGEVARWSIITAGFALGIAAFGGALGQGRAIAAASEAIARNPSATGDIRGTLILGLVLIESLVIYVFVISLILFFLYPFGK
jgi:F-type H+-transporting ATPase subunit c